MIPLLKWLGPIGKVRYFPSIASCFLAAKVHRNLYTKSAFRIAGQLGVYSSNMDEKRLTTSKA